MDSFEDARLKSHKKNPDRHWNTSGWRLEATSLRLWFVLLTFFPKGGREP